MARRSATYQKSLASVGILYLLGALLLLWLGTPFGLRGLAVDSRLALESGSDLPSQLEPGDRVIAVNDQPIHSRRELAAVLARSPAASVEVVVELRGRMRTVTLSQLRMENDPPAELLSAERIVRVDSEEILGAMPVSELHEYLERAAPTPIEVEYELQRAQIGGPASIQRRSHSPIVLAWLALGLLGMVGVVLLRSQRLSRLDLGALPVASAGAGALALGALTAIVVSQGVNPSFALWATAAVVAWRSLEAASRASRVDTSVAGLLLGAPALLALAGAAFVSVTAVGQDNVAAWLDQIDQYVVAAGALALAYYGGIAWKFGAEEKRARLAEITGVAAAVLATIAFAAFTELSITDAIVWGLLFGGGLLWPSDLAGSLESLGSENVRARGAHAGVGLNAGLIELREGVDPEYQVYGFVGIGEDFVAVTVDDPTGTGELRVVSVDAKPEVAAALSMLALEGGMFPRPMLIGEDSDDPFAELRVRLGFEAVVPVGVDGARPGVQTFVAAIGKDVGAHKVFPVEEFVESVQDTVSPLFVTELVAIGSESLLRGARRLLKEARTGSGGSAPTRARKTAPAAAKTTPAPTAPTAPPEDGAWGQHLDDELRRSYPVDDPDALDDREWLALGFLRESIQPALIIGEPATGKEFVARAVHEAMWGTDRRFATVDCAVRPPSIVDVELFGGEDEPGLVEAIGKGTLLLKGASHLGESRLRDLVPRLCRTSCRVVFAERYRGDEDGVPASVPETLVRFCEDRNIHLSPLRERKSDILRFANYFLHRAAMRYDVMVTRFSEDAVDHLRRLELSGNFLELEARVMSAVLRAQGEVVGLSDLGLADQPQGSAPSAAPLSSAASAVEGPATEPPAPENARSKSASQTTLALGAIGDDSAASEKAQIAAALEAAGGNRTKAAEQLGYTRGKLLRRLKKYGLG